MNKITEQLKSLAIVGTHDGIFHTDEIAAYCLLWVVCQRLGIDPPGTLYRTRKSGVLEGCQLWFDVGMVYDPENLRFDHHQNDPKLVRENEIQYSSFGLLFEWLKPALLEIGLDEESLSEFEMQLVLPIDASDNGQDLVSVYNFADTHPVQPIVLQNIINSYRPRWDEFTDMDACFIKACDVMRRFIDNQIGQLLASRKARKFVHEAVERSGTEAKILDFNGPSCPWQRTLLKSGSQALFVVFFDNTSGTWRVQAVPRSLGSFKNRAELPVMDELPEGISFIHKGGYIAGGTKRAVVALAEYAVSKLADS